ncbi:hypothetical protein EK0264_17115 [Epidermidibacterium keratini]|uniref:DUF3137 domain-containing protein n=1 Tax=Epidermidibacterium keratini TaxID=1891644 RepID=A0A7L4YS00_9ACTN|nr:hypothetical protein [Epidermidibacterium keratini]QHC01828.1 hypothetical protein EK0264_17115 [Epidermidibacterium keratini]
MSIDKCSEVPDAGRTRRRFLLVAAAGAPLLGGAVVLLRTGRDSTAIKAVGLVGAVLVMVGMIGAFVAERVAHWRARRAFAGEQLADLPQIPPDHDRARDIMSTRVGTENLADRFPAHIVASRRVPAGASAADLLVNIGGVRSRLRFGPREQIEPDVAIWSMPTGPLLPRLLVVEENRTHVAPRNTDVDIEHEGFNRRFRVFGSSSGGDVGDGVRHDEFARYASALLHPRAAQCLSRLPREHWFVIDREYAAVVGPPVAQRERVLLCADVLAEFVSLIPRHVRDGWGRSDYRTRD